MNRIVIKPAWIVSSDAGDHFEPQLFPLLRAIHETGKLTQAVEVVEISYRHGWDLLAKWGGVFGSELVAMERGRGARLTALGEKLLWAEQRTEASLFPQLENIANELNVAIRKSRQRAATILRIQASHGYAVEKLPELVRRHGHAEIDLRYVGSVEALAALSRSACDLAGFHVPLGDLGPMLWEQYAQWVKPQQQRIIRMVIRTQGLIVAKGNPLNIQSLHDLTRKGIKFVNRQLGSGTRLLLDGLLNLAIDPALVTRIRHRRIHPRGGRRLRRQRHGGCRPGHRACRASIRAGICPSVKERYMLTCSTETLVQPAVAELIALLKGPDFPQMLDSVAGYSLDQAGEVVSLPDVLPWLTRPARS